MDAKNRFKKSISDAVDNTAVNIKNNIEDNIETNIKDNIETNIKDNIKTNINSDILNKVLDGNKRTKGSNFTFYLSPDVGDALNKLSKKSKKSKSTIVDQILKEVLLNY